MANADTPRGFRPYGELKHVGIYIAGGTIYPGDAVCFAGGDNVETRRRAEVVAGSAAAALCGVALNYATDGQSVRVADDPMQLFVGQTDGADVDKQLDIGLNCPLVATTGDTTYKVSRQELDSSDIDTTATDEFKILGIVERQDGKNSYGANVECIVKINNHQLGSSTGTAGV